LVACAKPAANGEELTQQVVTRSEVCATSRTAAQLAELGTCKRSVPKVSIERRGMQRCERHYERSGGDRQRQLRARRAFFEIKSAMPTRACVEIVNPRPRRVAGLLQRAERATGIGWQYLAAINFIETASVAYAGCRPPARRGHAVLAVDVERVGIGKAISTMRMMPSKQPLAIWCAAAGRPTCARHSSATTTLTRMSPVTRTRVMKSDERAFLGFYNWEIYFSTSDAICGSRRRVPRAEPHHGRRLQGKSAVVGAGLKASS